MMANTMAEAPRRPTKEMNACCLNGYFRKGVRMANTEAGRATSSRKTKMASAGTMALASRAGRASRPSIKKMSTCIRLVTPSKKLTRDFLSWNSSFPRMMPAI